MTDREYIDVGDLTRIRTMRREFREIIAASSAGKITAGEYAQVRTILFEWEQRYTAVVGTE